MTIEIDELNPTILPSREHEVPAMRSNVTVKLTLAQILGLLLRGDLAGKLVSEDVSYDGTDSGLVAADVQAAVDELAVLAGKAVRTDIAQTFAVSEQARARENIQAGLMSGTRNKLINGNFDVWQRGLGPASGTGYLTADRWINQHVGSTKTHEGVLFDPVQVDVPGHPKYYSRTTVTSAVAAGNYVSQLQRIERVATSAGKLVTLTFWAKADAVKNLAFELYQSFGTGGSPSAVVAQIGVNKFELSTAWQKFSFTISIPSIAGKVLGTGGDDHLAVRFWYDAGTNFNGNTSSLGHQSGVFDIARVSLVNGDATLEADPAPPDLILDLMKCLRFYQVPAAAIISATYGAAASTHYQTLVYPVIMRKTPTVAFTSPIYVNSSAIATLAVNSRALTWSFSITALGHARASFTLTLDAEI